MRKLLLLSLLCGFFVNGAALASLAMAEESTSFRVVYFGEMGGQLVEEPCDPTKRTLSDFASTVYAILGVAEEVPSLVLSSGNLFGDAPLFEFLLNQGEYGILRVSELLALTQVALVVPGMMEFAIPHRRFLEFLPEYEKGGLVFRGANLECAPEARRCRHLANGAARIVDVGGVRVGLIPLVAPEFARVVPPANLEGITIKSPLETTRTIVSKWRSDGAVDVVIALVNLDVDEGSSAGTLDYASRVSGVDIVIAGGLQSDEKPWPVIRQLETRNGRPLVVGTPQSPGAVGSVTVTLKRKDGKLEWVEGRVATHEPDAKVWHPDAHASLIQALSEYCILATRFLGDGRIDPPMDWMHFVEYVLEIVRRDLGTDLAVVSDDSVRLARDVKLKGVVSSGLIYDAFEQHQLVVLHVRGKTLTAFLKAYFAKSETPPRVILMGASLDKYDVLTVNGRPINENRYYSIATTDFLGAGGKGYLDSLLKAPLTRRSKPRAFLEEVVRQFFEENRFSRKGDFQIDGTKNFSSLFDLPLWDFGVALTAGFSNITIGNDDSYTESQLNRSRFLGFAGDGQTLINVSTRDHNVSQFLKLQYAMAQTGEKDLSETQDLITEELSYSWTRVRNVWGKGKAYIPVPALRGKLETEFSQGEERDYHHLELTGTVGAQWVFTPKINAGVAYGLRNEVTDPEDTIHYGVEVYYQVNTLPIVSWDEVNKLTLDSRFELFYSDWTTDNIVKGLGSTKISTEFLGVLAFSVGLDVFIYREKDGQLGYSLDTTFGLTFAFDSAMQQF